MRFIGLGDTHGNHGWLSKVILEYVPRQNAELILQFGDFGVMEAWWPLQYGFRNKYESIEKFLDRTEKKLAQNDVPLYFIDGNHDDVSYIYENGYTNEDGFVAIRDHILYCPRGHRWEWGGVRYLALGGAISADKGWSLAEEERNPHKKGKLWFPTEKITDEDVGKCLVGGETDVLVTHDSPWGVHLPGITSLGPEYDDNRRRITEVIKHTRPDIVLHGHYHMRISEDLSIRAGDDDTFVETRVEGFSWDGDDRRHNSWAVLEFKPREGSCGAEGSENNDSHGQPSSP